MVGFVFHDLVEYSLIKKRLILQEQSKGQDSVYNTLKNVSKKMHLWMLMSFTRVTEV
jgi:hypothetical protein